MLSNDFTALSIELDELTFNQGDEFVGHTIRKFTQTKHE